jgi:hypothetical protein
VYEFIRVALESVQTIAPEAINLVLISELAWAAQHNLFGFEATVIEQVDDPPLPLIGQNALNDRPPLALMIAILRSWVVWGIRLRKGLKLLTGIGPKRIDDHTIET